MSCYKICNMRRPLFLLLIAAVALSTPSAAFMPASPRRLVNRKSSSSIRLAPEHLDVVSSFLQHHQQHHYINPFVLLSDAAAVEENVGWWDQYVRLFKYTLEFVHNTLTPPLNSLGVEQTWGISIAVFTAGIRTLLVPLSIQQSKSAEYMKALKPYISEIKTKYKDNQDAQNRAVAKLYEDAKQNPLAGCLFSLVQLPVFLGLYRGVRSLANEAKLQESFLWIPSLEGPVRPPSYQGLDWILLGWHSDPTGASNIPIPSLGWETTLAFLVMPVLLVILQGATMRVLQPPTDDSMSDEERETIEKSQRFLKFLPLLIGFFSLQVPAGLTIYWLTSNVYTLTQSLSVRAYFAANPPKIELPDYWDAALKSNKDFESMTPEERRSASEAGIGVGPKLEDLVDEAKFHCLIERKDFRTQTEAWERASQASAVPAVFESWVGSSNSNNVNGKHEIESVASDSSSSIDVRQTNTTAVASTSGGSSS